MAPDAETVSASQATRPPSSQRRGGVQRRARPLDSTEELVVAVAERLGFDVPAIAQGIYGRDTRASRASISSFLKELGPIGKTMALRLAGVLLEASSRPAYASKR